MQDLSAILGLKSAPIASGIREPAPEPGIHAPDASGAPSPLMRRVGFAVLFSLTACATTSAPGIVPGGSTKAPLTPYARALGFVLEAPPEEALGARLNLWATHYYTPEVRPAAETISAAFPLLGRDGSPISPPLLHRDWCEAALQGSVSVVTGDKATAYVFIDANGPEQADCDRWLGSLTDTVKSATRRARFMKVNHPLGCGVRNHPLLPLRTIAVDSSVIPLESVVFVPELRGRVFRSNGRDFVHDGYLFAGDRGGAIKGRHIDVFMQGVPAAPLEDLFASTGTRTFGARVVDPSDPMAKALVAAQSDSCEAN